MSAPFRAPVDAPLHEFEWKRPSGNHEFRVTQRYGDINGDVDARHIHGGTDMGSGQLPGRNAYALDDGVVVATGPLSWPWSQPTSQFPTGNYGGIMVVTRHGADWITAHAHLNDVAVKAAQQVKRGQLIGHVGKTGIAALYGTHLHVDCYHRLAPGEATSAPTISYDGATWAKVDVWPLLEQNYQPEGDVKLSGTFVQHIHNAQTRFAFTTNFRPAANRTAGDGDPALGIAAKDSAFYPVVEVKGETVGSLADADRWFGGLLWMPKPYYGYCFGYAHSSTLARKRDVAGKDLGTVDLQPVEQVEVQVPDEASKQRIAAAGPHLAAAAANLQAAATAQGKAATELTAAQTALKG